MKSDIDIQYVQNIVYKRKYWILLSLVLLSTIFVRFRLLDFPFERDEGEFAYIAYLILEGIPPYTEAANMKLPGTYYMYAFFMMLFGQTVKAVHFGLLLVSLANILLVHKISEKLFNSFSAIFTAATFAVISVNHSVLGFAAHATHFVLLPVLAGMLLFLVALESKRSFAFLFSGILLGIGLIMKQPGLVFIPIPFFFINWKFFTGPPPINISELIKTNCLLLLGLAIPISIILLYIYTVSDFDKFLFWIFQYGYDRSTPLTDAFSKLMTALAYVADGFALLWIIALAGLLALYKATWKRDAKVFTALFVFFSFLAVVPGFHFRPHYFVLLLPAVALLVGNAMHYFNEMMKDKFILPQIGLLFITSIYLTTLMIGMILERDYFITPDGNQLAKKIYQIAPFPESKKIAEEIAERTNPDDKIFVFGNEPQIYFHANRRSATSFMYLYPLMETHDNTIKMQKQMISEVELAQPEIIVITQTISWNIKPNSDTYIYQWLHEYTQANYNLIGVIDIIPQNSTIYRWDTDAINYIPLSNYYLLVLRKSPYQIQNSVIRYNYLSPFGPLGSGMPFLENQPEEIIPQTADFIHHAPIEVPLPDETNNIYFGLDTVTMNENVLKITGWGFIDKQNAENTRQYICLKSDVNQYVFDTENVNMPSISEAFGNPKLDKSGFKTSIETGHLAPGVYSIGIYINKEETIEALTYSDYRITVLDQLNLP